MNSILPSTTPGNTCIISVSSAGIGRVLGNIQCITPERYSAVNDVQYSVPSSVRNCCSVHYNAVYYSTVHFNAVYCSAVHCSAVHCSSLDWSGVHWRAVHCSEVAVKMQCSTLHLSKTHSRTTSALPALNSIKTAGKHCTVMPATTLRSTVRLFTALRSRLYWKSLHCILMY